MSIIVEATCFGQIVSLLGQFISGRENKNKFNYYEFQVWLQQNSHEEIFELLQVNTKAVIGIKSLLNDTRSELLAKIETIEKSMLLNANFIDGFSDLVAAISPDNAISFQAIDILSQIDKFEGSKFIVSKNIKGIEISVLGGNGRKLVIKEKRFIYDDIRVLDESGLIIKEGESESGTVYVITRAASALVNVNNN